MKIQSVEDLFDAVGGSVQLAAKLDVHQTTVLGWRERGVPVRYWAEIMKFIKISADDLYRISERATNDGER